MVTAAVTIARPQTDGKHSDRPRWDVGTSWGLCRRCAGASDYHGIAASEPVGSGRIAR